MESEVEEVMENQIAAHIAAHDLVVLPTAYFQDRAEKKNKKDWYGGNSRRWIDHWILSNIGY